MINRLYQPYPILSNRKLSQFPRNFPSKGLANSSKGQTHINRYLNDPRTNQEARATIAYPLQAAIVQILWERLTKTTEGLNLERAEERAKQEVVLSLEKLRRVVIINCFQRVLQPFKGSSFYERRTGRAFVPPSSTFVLSRGPNTRPETSFASATSIKWINYCYLRDHRWHLHPTDGILTEKGTVQRLNYVRGCSRDPEAIWRCLTLDLCLLDQSIWCLVSGECIRW